MGEDAALDAVLERVPPDIADAYQKVRAALEYMPVERADKAIGKDGYGLHGQLVEAVVAQHRLLAAELISAYGLEPEKVAVTVTHQQQIVLQLLHYLYACGIIRGRKNGTRP